MAEMTPLQVEYPETPDSTVEAEIASLAFQKWLHRGGPSGTGLQDWLEAEDEVRQRREVLHQLTEVERRLIAEHAVSHLLAASKTLSDATRRLIHAACESLGWDVGAVWVMDPNANVLRCVGVWHAADLDGRVRDEDLRQRTVSPGVGIPGRVWADDSPIWVPDMTAGEAPIWIPDATDDDASVRVSDVVTDAAPPTLSIAAEAGLRGAVGFPIRVGTEFLGVMEFLSRQVQPADEELAETMACICSQVGQFIERTTAEAALLKQQEERRIARRIQQGLLPKAMPAVPGFRISGWLLNAEDVGGDCFDFIPIQVDGNEQWIALVGDASGHGIASALLIAETRAYLRAFALTCTDLGTLLTLTNRRLASDLESEHFVTLLLVQLDPSTRSLVCAGAGHWPAYVLDREGRTKAVLSSTGFPLGIDAASEFPTGPPTFLKPGELVLMYTDGVVEAAAPDGELFGLQRTLDVVRAHRHEAPEQVLESLFDAVGDFSRCHFHDDLTAVVIEVEEAERADLA
jgi:serine phosphatase RsbU (regulator of sigma subunit)